MRLNLETIKEHYDGDEVCRTKRGIEVRCQTFFGNNIVAVFPENKEVSEEYLQSDFFVTDCPIGVENTFGINCHGHNPCVHTGKFAGGKRKTYYFEPLPPEDEDANAAIISITIDAGEEDSFIAPQNTIGDWKYVGSRAVIVTYLVPITERQRPELVKWFSKQRNEQKAWDEVVSSKS